MLTESKRKANARYHARTIKAYKLALNKNTDAELINYLDQVPNKNGLIKELLYQHMQVDENYYESE